MIEFLGERVAPKKLTIFFFLFWYFSQYIIYSVAIKSYVPAFIYFSKFFFRSSKAIPFSVETSPPPLRVYEINRINRFDKNGIRGMGGGVRDAQILFIRDRPSTGGVRRVRIRRNLYVTLRPFLFDFSPRVVLTYVYGASFRESVASGDDLRGFMYLRPRTRRFSYIVSDLIQSTACAVHGRFLFVKLTPTPAPAPVENRFS